MEPSHVAVSAYVKRSAHFTSVVVSLGSDRESYSRGREINVARSLLARVRLGDLSGRIRSGFQDLFRGMIER